jgi:cell wall-associated NlpC family hydrolase
MRLDEAARRYLGVPWKHQARGPAFYDCIGLVIQAGKDCGRPWVGMDATNYDRNPHHGVLESYVCSAVEPGPLEPGAIVTIAFARITRHLAIVGEQNGYLTLIHSDAIFGRVVEHRLDSKWQRRITGVYRG